MADIPVISITQVEGQNDSADDDGNENFNSNHIHEALTDVEDLDSDEGQSRRSSHSRLSTKRKQSDGGITDVEDYNASDDEDDDANTRSDNEEKYPNSFLLQEFLDQGFVNESMHMSGLAGGQSGTRRSFRTKIPQCNIDGAITDYENIETSDDDADEIPPRPVTPGKYNDILILSAGMNSVSISDHVSRRESIFSLATSESDEEAGPKPRSALKKPKRVKAFNVSDVENILFTEEEADYCGAIRHSKSAFDAEEMYIESSDTEEYRSEKRVSFPDIDISFGRLKPADCVLRNRKQKTVRQATGNSGMMLRIDRRRDDDGGHTDVENLNSSDDDDETNGCIPMAFVRSDQYPLTDVEDFDDGDEDCVQSDADDGSRDIRMPSPMREMTIVKEAATGARIAKVMPMLDAHFLGIEDTYMDKGLTDTEDLSGNEEDFQETVKYPIDTLPDLDGGVVHNSESVRPFVRDRMKSSVLSAEPLTDTEDLNMGVTTTGGVRRKKIKGKSGGGAQKPRKFLDAKNVTNTAPLTDYEELSDEADGHHISEPVTVSVSPANDGSKTDTELMSGDEGFDVNDDIIADIDPAALQQESYFSVVTSRDACSTTNKRSHFRNINRKFSPTPDMYLATQTDSEDVQCISDTDDLLTADAVLRTNCVTPQALQEAVIDYGSQNSFVHDINTSVFDMAAEATFIKGHQTVPDIATDIEFLDEDIGGVAEDETEDPNAIHKSAESIH